LLNLLLMASDRLPFVAAVSAFCGQGFMPFSACSPSWVRFGLFRLLVRLPRVAPRALQQGLLRSARTACAGQRSHGLHALVGI